MEIDIILSVSAMHWIMSPEPKTTTNVGVVPIIEDSLTSKEYLESQHPITYLRQHLIVSPEVIRSVAALTVGQRTNQLWAVVRKMRITASNFGPVLQAVRLNR